MTKMKPIKLSEKIFRINAKPVTRKIEHFIKEKCLELNRKGIVVPISGGLDSSVVAALCTSAVGKNKVIGLMLPEKQGNPEVEQYSKQLASFLNIKTKMINITKILESAGAYNFVLAKLPSRLLQEKAVRSYLSSKLLIEELKGSNRSIIRKGFACFSIKQRVRLLATYKFAEENNLLVVGSAHKTENLVGLYVKFGVDDGADVMPLKNLYRSQTLQLGKYLQLPKNILDRSPSPDIIPGVEDKYLDFLGIESSRLDLVLYGLEHKMTYREIAQQVGISVKQVEDIDLIMRLSSHMRHPSLSP